MSALWSTKREGSFWVAPPASLFTLNASVQVLPPSSDLEKNTSAWVVDPPQPAYAR